MTVELWQAQFGEALNPGREVRDAVAAGDMTDTSWGNDTCPSFTRWQDCTARNDHPKIVLWVEHPNPDNREFAGPRYTVVAVLTDAVAEPLIQTDRAEVALAVFRAHRFDLDAYDIVRAVQAIADKCSTLEDLEWLAGGEQMSDDLAATIADIFGVDVRDGDVAFQYSVQAVAVRRGLQAMAERAIGK